VMMVRSPPPKVWRHQSAPAAAPARFPLRARVRLSAQVPAPKPGQRKAPANHLRTQRRGEDVGFCPRVMPADFPKRRHRCKESSRKSEVHQ
jgi:hypothetical protein